MNMVVPIEVSGCHNLPVTLKAMRVCSARLSSHSDDGATQIGELKSRRLAALASLRRSECKAPPSPFLRGIGSWRGPVVVFFLCEPLGETLLSNAWFIENVQRAVTNEIL